MKERGLALQYLTLVAVAVGVHFSLIPVGIALHDADQFFYPLAAEHAYRAGEWSAFPFTQEYGGMGYSWIRALWTAFFTALAGDHARIFAQLAFSYLVSPVLIAVTCFALLRRYCTTRAAWWAGLLAAVGYHYCANIIGIDTYVILPILGSIVFTLRAGTLNPFLELPLSRLVISSIVLGYGVFTFRPTLIYAVAFFTPWAWLLEELRRFWFARSLGDRLIRRAVLGLGFFYFYLQVFSGDLGKIWGHSIRIAGGPNLEIAVMLIGVWLAKENLKRIRTPHLIRGCMVGAGLLVGFFPELIHWIHLGGKPPWVAQNGAASPSFEHVIHALRELVLGQDDRTPDPTFLRNAPLLLLVVSIIALFREARRAPQFQPFCAILILNLIAFMNVHVTSPGATRYLFAIYPALNMAIAVLMDRAIRRGPVWSRALIVLILASCAYQVTERLAWAHAPSTLMTREERLEIVERFRAMGVHRVWSDDYWHTLAHSFISGEDPLFIADDVPWPKPPHWLPEGERPLTMGVLLIGKVKPSAVGVISALGTCYRLEEPQILNQLRLFRARRVDGTCAN